MQHIPTPDSRRSGFTLIELSIVLVIIGLVVGGVMVGKDLIYAARIRAQITQIEKYNTAVNTFNVKYNAIPGDMEASVAAANGFATRAGTEGRGDGNGLLEGSASGSSNVCGETALFWNDLVTAGLIGENIAKTTTATIAQGDTDGDLLHCPGSRSTDPK